jgi:hypothetical protein
MQVSGTQVSRSGLHNFQFLQCLFRAVGAWAKGPHSSWGSGLIRGDDGLLIEVSGCICGGVCDSRLCLITVLQSSATRPVAVVLVQAGAAGAAF